MARILNFNRHLATLGFCLISLTSLASSNDWITADEYQQEQDYISLLPEEMFDLDFGVSLGADQQETASTLPQIIIIKPEMNTELKGTVEVDIKFKTEDDVGVDTNSIRILYGWMRMDITDRIRQYAKISADGIYAKNAKFPKGKHKILISAVDQAGKSLKKQISFSVADF